MFWVYNIIVTKHTKKYFCYFGTSKCIDGPQAHFDWSILQSIQFPGEALGSGERFGRGRPFYIGKRWWGESFHILHLISIFQGKNVSALARLLKIETDISQSVHISEKLVRLWADLPCKVCSLARLTRKTFKSWKLKVSQVMSRSALQLLRWCNPVDSIISGMSCIGPLQSSGGWHCHILMSPIYQHLV